VQARAYPHAHAHVHAHTNPPNGRYISLVVLILDIDTLGPEMRAEVGLGFRV